MNDTTAHCRTSRLPRRRWAGATIAGAAALAAMTGCQLWPFGAKERTTLITPSMRAASIREMAPRNHDADQAEQERLCQQLAQQIRTEPDPIVRKAIQETIAQFDVPLAETVLLAGLNDEDRDVKVTCCGLLGERGKAEAIGPLTRLVAADGDLDVRLAAVDALGAIKTPAAIPGLAAALKDRDPAMQYAGVEAMKLVTDQDLGNDVEAWRKYAASVVGSPDVAVASQPSAGAAVK